METKAAVLPCWFHLPNDVSQKYLRNISGDFRDFLGVAPPFSEILHLQDPPDPPLMWGDIETELARYVGDGPPFQFHTDFKKRKSCIGAGILWVQSRWYTCKLWIFMNFAFSVQHGTIWQMLSFLMAIEVWLSSGLWPRGSTTVLQCEALALPTLEDPHVSGYRSWRDRTTLALDGRKNGGAAGNP